MLHFKNTLVRRLKCFERRNKTSLIGVALVRLIEHRQLAKIISLFLIVQLTGVLIVFYIAAPSQVVVTNISTNVSPSAASYVVFLFIYVIVGGVVMVLLFKRYHGPRLFIGIEAIVVFMATFYLFLIILSAVFPQSIILPLLGSFVGGAAVVFAKNKWQGLRNFVAILASIGVGLILGLVVGSNFGFFTAFVIMALIALYDYVAVFITKHMVTLGNESVNRNLAFMVGAYDVELMPQKNVKKKEMVEIRKAIASTGNRKLKELMKAGNVPMAYFSALGAGDLGFPLMLAVSAYVTYFSYFFSLLIIIGAAIGLMFAMIVSKKYNMALPAIPPIFAFCSISVAIQVFITSPARWQLGIGLLVGGVFIVALMLLTASQQSRRGLGAKITAPRPA